MVSELKDTLDRGAATDPVGAHMFMKAYVRMSPSKALLLGLEPAKVQAVRMAAGPPWSEGGLPQAPLPGVDLMTADKALALQILSAARALQALNAQPWGALICELVDKHGLFFRPAAKYVHRGLCEALYGAEKVAELLRRALQTLGFAGDYGRLAAVMCGNADPPADASARRVCTDLAGMGRNSENAAAAKKQALEQTRVQEWERREAESARRYAEHHRAHQKWLKARSAKKRLAFQQNVAAGLVAAAAVAAITTFVVRRKKKRR